MKKKSCYGEFVEQRSHSGIGRVVMVRPVVEINKSSTFSEEVMFSNGDSCDGRTLITSVVILALFSVACLITSYINGEGNKDAE